MTRQALVERWWDFWPGKPMWLEHGVARVLCWRWGHEEGRAAGYCCWCGGRL